MRQLSWYTIIARLVNQNLVQCFKLAKLNSCGTKPSSDLAASKSVSMSCPNTWTRPALLFTNDEITPMVVDLPAPFGPSKAKKSPCELVSRCLYGFNTIFINLFRPSIFNAIVFSLTVCPLHNPNAWSEYVQCLNDLKFAPP